MDDVRGHKWFKEFQDYVVRGFLNLYNNKEIEYMDMRITMSKRKNCIRVNYPTSLGQKSEDVPLKVDDGVS